VPSGRVHEIINLSALGLASAGYWAYQKELGVSEPIAVAFVGSFLLGTFLVTPDLDLAEQNVRAKGRWGLLGLFWVPYGLMFSHRGLSHTWIVGPLTRILYMGAVGVAIYWLFRMVLGYLHINFDLQGRLQAPPQAMVWGLVLGYYISQWLHIAADGVWPDTLLGRRRRR